MWTNGDVTLRHWYQALSYKAGANHEMTLMVATPDVEMLRWLRQWMQRGWTTRLQLTTATDCTELVKTELEGLTDRVSVATDETLHDELLLLRGDKATLLIQGRMLSAPLPGITTYAAVVTDDKYGGELRDLIAAINARHKRHVVAPTEGDATPPDANRKRRKKKA